MLRASLIFLGMGLMHGGVRQSQSECMHACIVYPPHHQSDMKDLNKHLNSHETPTVVSSKHCVPFARPTAFYTVEIHTLPPNELGVKATNEPPFTDGASPLDLS